MILSIKSKLRFLAHVIRSEQEIFATRANPRVSYLGLTWCDPRDIKLSTRYFVPKKGGFLHSGQEIPKRNLDRLSGRFIIGGDWDLHFVPINDVKLFQRTIERYSQKRSWESVSEINWMMENIAEYGVQDGCLSLADVLSRCNRFDQLKEALEKGERLVPQKQMNPRNFRERGGIGVAIARNGDLIWFDNGAHRLAIAHFLRLKEIPVCIHMIHAEAVENKCYMTNIYMAPRG